MARLFVAISSHGYGHFGQTAPVLNALARRAPDTEFIIQTALPIALLRSRLNVEFTHIAQSTDLGVAMTSALDVDRARAASEYAAYHARWDEHLAAQCALYERYRPDALFGNIPYLPFAAAKKMGLPAVALCSLNWADILEFYCPQHHAIVATMREAYRSAEVFLCPAPSMVMPGLDNTRGIGPITFLGQSRRDEILRQRGLSNGCRLVMVAPGGIPTSLPLASWPQRPNWLWITTWPHDVRRDDILDFRDLPLGFSDWVASCDVVITKPGYGMIAECVCNQVPVLYVTRGDWPEEPCLVGWLEQNGKAMQITRDQFFSGNVWEAVERVMSLPAKQPVFPSGVDETAGVLATLLDHAR